MSFTLWAPIDAIFTSSGGNAITGQHWDRSQGTTQNGDPLWIDSATPTAGYNVNTARTYTYYLGAADRLTQDEDAVVLATTTMVFPFLTGSGASNSASTTLLYSTTNGVTSGGALYWVANAISGYDLMYRGLSVTVANVPQAASAITLTGSATPVITGVTNPDRWTFASTSAGFLVGYATSPSVGATTRDVYLQAFNAAGVATSSLVHVATAVPSGFEWGVSSDGTNYYYSYEDNTTSNATVITSGINPTTGALTVVASVPTGLTDILTLDTRFVGSNVFGITEGTDASGHWLQVADFAGNPIAQVGSTVRFSIAASGAIRWQTQAIANNQMVLVYADNNQVHLELFDAATGAQVGSDFIVPGITSFDRIRSLGDGRIELLYRATQNTDPAALIYDTRTVGAVLAGTSGNDLRAGTPFDDTITASAGNDTYQSAGGVDTVNYSGQASGIVMSVNAFDDMIVAKNSGGTDTLINVESVIGTGFADILIGNSAGNTLSGGVGDDTLIGGVGVNTLIGGGGFDRASYASITRAQATITHNANGTTTVASAVGGFTDTLTGIERAVFSDRSVSLLETARTDANGDGTSDLLLRDGAGNVLDWSMSNYGVTAGSSIGGAAGYTVLGTGDFNGDGTGDVLLRGDASNVVATWQVSNGTFLNSTLISSDSSGYGYVGTGDINNDGSTDIVLQNGALIAAWKNVGGVVTGVAIGTAVGYGADAVGDINGDGSADIIMHDAAGNLVSWLLDGNGQIASGVLIAGGLTSYGVAGVADFNGDGTADILLRQFGTGYLVDLQMTNGHVSAVNNLGLDNGMTLIGLGDYNNDGTADIAFQSGGTVSIWNMNNGLLTNTTLVTNGLAGYTVIG